MTGRGRLRENCSTLSEIMSGKWSYLEGQAVDLSIVTIEDCIDMYEKKDATTIINDGKVIGFETKK